MVAADWAQRSLSSQEDLAMDHTQTLAAWVHVDPIINISVPSFSPQMGIEKVSIQPELSLQS